MKNNKIVIFGGSGSLGSYLIDTLVNDNEIVVYSRDEAKHWALKNKFANNNLSFFIGDARDFNRVNDCIKKTEPNIVIIASALKHVDVCENSPSESILTNVIGPKNITDACFGKRFIDTVLMVSTDKACSPINTYGLSKGLAEKYVLEKSRYDSGSKYIAVRYGNVLESRGSIIPLFHYQGMFKSKITITDPTMTRFIMTLPESVSLIIRALKNAKNGEMFIPRIKSMMIKDLSSIFSDLYNKPVKEIGVRVGEKIHEYLVNETESARTIKEEEDFIIKSIFDKKIYNKNFYDFNSGMEDLILKKEDLRVYLEKLGMLEKNIDKFEEAEGSKYAAIRKTDLKSHEQ